MSKTHTQNQKTQDQKFTIDLPKKDAPNNIQYYIEQNMDEGLKTGLEHLIGDLDNKDTQQQYFNFGFNRADFEAYIRKIIWMKNERQIIEQAILQTNNIQGLKEFYEPSKMQNNGINQRKMSHNN